MKQLRGHIEKCVYKSKESCLRTHALFQQFLIALCSHTHGRVTEISGLLKNILTLRVEVCREHYSQSNYSVQKPMLANQHLHHYRVHFGSYFRF